MKSCSTGHCVLCLLLLIFTTVSGSAVPSVKVKVHDAAILPCCSGTCPGLVEWYLFGRRSDVLAQCNQTSCKQKEGFQMFHDQYLEGNLYLNITDADFSKRNTYTCRCDGTDICDIQLQIEPLKSAVQIKQGEPLTLDLDVSDPVEVIYSSTGEAGPSGGLICKVDGRSLQFKSEYSDRVALTSVLQLRGMKPPDSGVYTIRDSESKEDIHTYTVTVTDDPPAPDPDKEAAGSEWLVVVVVVVVVVTVLMGAALVGVCVISGVVIVRKRREIQQLRMKSKRNGSDMNGYRTTATEPEAVV